MNAESKYQPSNGRVFVCLAGGDTNTIPPIRERLAKHGVLIEHHLTEHVHTWPSPTPRLDAVLLLKDAMTYARQEAIASWAKAHGVPVIRTQQQWTKMADALRKRGLLSERVPEELHDSPPSVGRTVRAQGPPLVTTAVLARPPPPEAEALSALVGNAARRARRAWTMARLEELQRNLQTGECVTIVVTPSAIALSWQ